MKNRDRNHILTSLIADPGHRSLLSLVIVSVILTSILFLSTVTTDSYAATSTNGQWFMQLGRDAPTASGSYVSSSGGLNSYYAYFIEVPSGLSRFDVDIFDPDVGVGGSSEVPNNLDRAVSGWNTTCRYRLSNPGGTPVVTYDGDSTKPAAGDNAWINFYSTTSTPIPNGHWELDVLCFVGNDINAYGIRAHDGTSGSGGTELNIYTHSYVTMGTNNTDGDPTSGDTRSYDLYPYITSGCLFDSNDFDFDRSFTGAVYDSSVAFTSRSGGFSQTLVETSLSDNDGWVNNVLSGWTSDTSVTEHGIWHLQPTIYEIASAGGAGNYTEFYAGDFRAASPPPTTQPESNTYRIYLPTDGGTVPLKPYLTQTVSHISGPNPPTTGNTTRLEIEITFSNPTAHSIVFTPTGQGIRTAIPTASEVVYADTAAFTQGSIRTPEPPVGGSGVLIWDPGTVTSGSTITLTYRVDVNPSLNGQRIPITGTPTSLGTIARYDDLTSTEYSFGPLCELAVTESGDPVPTVVLLSTFDGYEQDGKVVVEWETVNEVGTIGFHLYRTELSSDDFVRVNESLLPGLLHHSQGGTYRFVDNSAVLGREYTYKLVEVQSDGEERTHGPFTITVKPYSGGSRPSMSSFFSREPNLSVTPRPVPVETFKPTETSVKLKVPGENRIYLPLVMPGRTYFSKIDTQAKVVLTDEGLYYLSTADIAAALGIQPWQAIELIESNRLQLTNQGSAIAYFPDEGNGGIFFVGLEIESNYTKDNLYWLSDGQGLQMEILGGTGPNPAQPGTFLEVLDTEQDQYQALSLFSDPDADFWLWDYFIAGDVDHESKTFSIISNGATPPATASLLLRLQGGTDTGANPDHHAVIRLNGTQIGETRWNGTNARNHIVHFNQDLLNDGDNTIEILAVLDSGVPYSIFYIDSFELSYQQNYQAVENALFASADGHPVVTIGGFSEPGIMVFEVTNPLAPKLLTATTVDHTAEGFRVSFETAPQESRYLALNRSSALTPLSLTTDNASNLKSSGNRADYLLITTGELKASTQTLANYRQGQGHTSMVVTLEDIYDEFNHGIASPYAIRDFLSYAYNNWSLAPRYVALAGEGTVDYKGNQGYGDNLIPPILASTSYGLFASDNTYADVVGDDGLADFAIGRLPVSSQGELDVVISKIIAYEGNSGEWQSRILMLADNPDSGGNFTADSDDLSVLLSLEYDVEKVYLSELSLAEARQALLDGINNGVGLVNFLGHAGMDRFAKEGLLLTSDLPSLTNGDRLPVVTAMTCVVGRYELPGYDSLGEALILDPDGGAVAVWAPTGMSLNSEAKNLYQYFLLANLQAGSERLGDGILQALQDYESSGSMPTLLQIYTLLGDPALLLQLNATQSQ